MADLRDLHQALSALAASGKAGRISFYFTDANQKLTSGNVFVEDGATCYIHYLDRTPNEALAAIPGLRFAKISTLPAMASEHVDDVPGLPMAIVLEQLDPDTHAAELAPPAPAFTPAHVPMPALAAHPAGAAPVAAPAPAKPHAFYSHVAMQKDALDLLEPLYGTGAAKKVEEFARQSPPYQYPKDFLGKCRQHAAMMLGARKAEELFAPLFEKATH